MAINAISYLTALSLLTRVQAGQVRNGLDLLLGGLIFVLKAAHIPLGTRSPQIVIVAELVVFLPFFDIIEGHMLNMQRWVKASGTGIPRGRSCWL